MHIIQLSHSVAEHSRADEGWCLGGRPAGLFLSMISLEREVCCFGEDQETEEGERACLSSLSLVTKGVPSYHSSPL